ncbi:glycosyltransferase family 39 protein [Pseudorhodoplanes sp.]|uniref:ArnT family glycosyltransferase n=1 Tax=Pseudorhodoplanes sp. TaxID=1934341 RepID=UPI002CE62485|nr:glycosyltransferase family 39 protein [Pseudorhodoplanes sp.]HWV53155.1 glycosyltransferase family 39 protein [Pseudorhodoplanes sp.]
MATGWGNDSFARRNPRETWQRGLGGLLDYASATDTRAIVFVLIFSLLAFLPGQSKVPPIDRDEARFAQATKQMVDTGDYVDIRFQNDVRYQKPIGIYWMQAVALQTAEFIARRDLTDRIYVYRIPSLIGAVGAVLATLWVAGMFVSRRAAILAAMMMAASIMLGIEARLARTDAMLLFMTVLCMGVLARAYLPRAAEEPDNRALPFVFWIALGVGVLLKGPVILMLVGLPIVTLAAIDRSASWLKALRPLIGIPILLLLVLPWLLAISARTGSTFFSDSIVGDALKKVYTSQEGHGALPGYFIVLFFLTFWPASLLAGMAVPGVWREKWETPVKFLLAWLVPAWIVFELAITKLPHYVLPLYPAVAILLARAIETGQMSRKSWMEWGTFWWFAVPVLVFVGALFLLLRYEGELGWQAWPFLAAAIVFGFRAWWLYDVDGIERSLLRASVTTVLLSIAVYWSVLPALQGLFPSVSIQRSIHATGCKTPRIAAAGYHEPSMVFLSGTDTVLTSAAGAADFLRGDDDCRFAVVEQALERTFARRAEAIDVRYTQVSRFRGYSFGSGGRVAFTIYRSLGDR